MVELVGDIKNYIRKGKLESDIVKTIERIVDANIEVGDIYVIGSWGRGDAVPGRSDLDVLFIVKECEPKDDMPSKFKQTSNPCVEQIFEKTMTRDIKLDGLHPKINRIDLIPVGSQAQLELEIVPFLSDKEPNRGYNLTKKKVVWLDEVFELSEDNQRANRDR